MSQKALSTILLCVAVVLVTGGQLCLKEAVTRHPFDRAVDIFAILFSAWGLVGIAIYGVGSVAWLYGLAHLPFFLVTFFMIAPFALLLIASLVFYGERPAPIQWAGVVTLTVGLIMVSWRS